ncbi:MAG: hypothetical protein EON98_10710 [Chitinophagaceae bacterium]|nr:MAG: hypothetical protein EON98_10710 [Chitinophagaceae bacterium]
MKLTLLAFTLSVMATAVQAQPGGGGTGNPDPPRIPFDGGLSLVVAAGIAYAAKKGIAKRKRVNTNESSE